MRSIFISIVLKIKIFLSPLNLLSLNLSVYICVSVFLFVCLFTTHLCVRFCFSIFLVLSYVKIGKKWYLFLYNILYLYSFSFLFLLIVLFYKCNSDKILKHFYLFFFFFFVLFMSYHRNSLVNLELLIFYCGPKFSCCFFCGFFLSSFICCWL